MDSQSKESSKPKVCVIGGGPSGLLATRHLKDIAEVHTFEGKSDIGGVWLYTDTTELNAKDLSTNAFYNLYGCLHSSMYKDLQTNIPKSMMTFKDYYMDDSIPHISTHTEYIKYLNGYADRYELRDYIKLNTIVKSVKIDEAGPHRYCVKTVPTDMNESTEENTDWFDYVLVCNGKFFQSNIPNFEGKDSFKGTQFHIHNFRTLDPELFDDRNVLIVGAATSAVDILEMLFLREDTKSKVNPKKVFITSRNTMLLEGAKPYMEMREQGKLEIKKGNVKTIKENSVVFGDDSEEDVDTIIYATGYNYTYPFFDPEDKIIEFDEGGHCGRYFGPIYKKMFSINEKGIIFIGLIERLINIMATLERQVMLTKQYILGELSLPSKEEMLESLQSELDKNDAIGYPREKFYVFNIVPEGYTAFHYSADIEKMTNLPIDKGNYSKTIGKIIPLLIQLIKDGYGPQLKTVDYETLLEGIDFKPTSDTF